MNNLINKILPIILLCYIINANAFVLTGTRWEQPTATISLSLPGENGLWNTSFKSAMSDWNSATIFELKFLEESRDPCNFKDGLNGTGWKQVACGNLWEEGTLAITATLSRRSDNIVVESNIFYNSNLQWDVYKGPLQKTPNGLVIVEFFRVTLHELGHFLGLGHVADVNADAIMIPTISDLDSLRPDDINGVNTLYESEPGNGGEGGLLNISTRGFVGSGALLMHAGFVISGSGTLQVLIKAGGPSLPAALNGLQNPNLRLFNAVNGTLIHENDGWQTDPSSSLVTATGKAPTDPREPAFVISLPAGSYTAVVNGENGTTGISLPSVTKVDVADGGGSFNKTQTEKLVGGWDFRAQINNDLFSFTYSLPGPALEATNAPDVWLLIGQNTFNGNPVQAYYDPNPSVSLRHFFLINPVPGQPQDVIFNFEVSSNNNNVSGCLFLGENGVITSTCTDMNGIRTNGAINSIMLTDPIDQIMEQLRSMPIATGTERKTYYTLEELE